jgi:hypothetical protein
MVLICCHDWTYPLFGFFSCLQFFCVLIFQQFDFLLTIQIRRIVRVFIYFIILKCSNFLFIHLRLQRGKLWGPVNQHLDNEAPEANPIKKSKETKIILNL